MALQKVSKGDKSQLLFLLILSLQKTLWTSLHVPQTTVVSLPAKVNSLLEYHFLSVLQFLQIEDKAKASEECRKKEEGSVKWKNKKLLGQ